MADLAVREDPAAREALDVPAVLAAQGDGRGGLRLPRRLVAEGAAAAVA